MKELRIRVKDKIATLVNGVELVCGNSDYRVIFEFDEDWTKYNAKTALFVFGDTTIEVPFLGNVIDEKDAVAIERATKCYIGVFSGDLVTTTKAEVKCLLSIRDIAKTPQPPKEDVYNKIINLINEIELGGSAIIEVEELPTEDIKTSLLYRTPEGVYWYDGAWNKVADEELVKDLSRQIEETILPQIVNADYNENDTTNKAYIENRPFYDTRSTDENGEETGELKTLEDKYLDLENRAKFKEVESIAKGAGQAVSYGNYSTMITALNALTNDVYKVGQSIMIVTVEVPDLWVSAIGEESTEYTYTSDEDFVADLKANGSVKIGYYQLSQLETQKVDLTDYVKNTDYATNQKAGLSYTGTSGVNIRPDGNWYFNSVVENDFKSGSGGNFLKVMNTKYIGKYGIVRASNDSTLTLTDEEKASALAWLGAVGKTDYSTEGVAGLVKVTNYNGCFTTDGNLRFYGANEGEVQQRNSGGYIGNRLVKLDYFDLALKYGLISNKHTLTADEQASAQKWLGVPSTSKTIKFSNSGIVVNANHGDVYHQSNDTYSAEQMIGAKCVYYYVDSTVSASISENNIVENTADGLVFAIADFFIVVAYTENYQPSYDELKFSIFPKKGIYFGYGYNSDVRSLTINGTLDGKDISLADNAVIKALVARIEALENK